MTEENSNSLPLLTVIGAAGEGAEPNEPATEPNGDGPFGSTRAIDLAESSASDFADPKGPSPLGSAPSPDSAPADKPSARERLTSRRREGHTHKHRVGLILLIIFIVLLLAAAGAAVGGFAWLRWYAHDDAADFQGTWYVSGSEHAIEITADAIVLTPDVSYAYELDPQDKTIEMRLGNLEGFGSYRFSLDRTQLVIFDGRMEADAVMAADVRWLVQALIDEVTEEPNDVRAGLRKNLTFLTREPMTSQNDAATSSAEADAGASAAEDSASDSASSTDEEPQTVWSAEEWENSGSGGANAGPSTADDVRSLLEGINDLPAS